jgi:hypothetical protein
MKKHSALAVISLLSIAALSACGSQGGGSGGKGGRDTGGEGGDGDGGSGGTGGKKDGGTGGMKPGGSGGGGSGGGGSGGGGSGGSNPDGGMPGCEGPPDSVLCKPLADMPASIKATGFFPAPPNLEMHPAAMKEYVPDPALWSDGMEKQRFIVLPTGMKIDNKDRKQWAFPDGTIFIKTFFDDSKTGGKGRAIETRFIRKKAGLYEFFLYEWNAEGTDATLLVKNDGIDGMMGAEKLVPVTIKRTVNGQPFMVNNGMPFMHSLPSRQACGECHEENNMKAQAFIGFDEVRLNSKFKDTTKTQLQIFGGQTEPPTPSVFTMPIPTDPVTITDPNPGLQRIKRAVFGNCVHCHGNGSFFSLLPDDFVAATVNQPTDSNGTTMPTGWARIKPRAPNMSVLYVQVRRTMIPTMVNGMMVRMRPMSPVGVADQAADQALLTDLFAWINSL